MEQEKAEALNKSVQLKDVQVDGDLSIHLHTGQAESHKTSLESDSKRRYLQKLQTHCNLLPLAAIAEERDHHSSARLTLSQVYVGLNTTDFVDKSGKPATPVGVAMEARESFRRDEETRPLTAFSCASWR